jgi:aconitate hydratase
MVVPAALAIQAHYLSHIAEAVDKDDLVVASALSGNRNFEARVHPQVRMNFLMSPILVVAYAIAGRIDIDLINDPIAYDPNLKPVYLKDIWPGHDEIQETMGRVLSKDDFENSYSKIFEGNEIWQQMKVPEEQIYLWEEDSTYIKEAPFFKDISVEPQPSKDIREAHVLLMLGDSITTDHISPAGSFGPYSPAGQYLKSKDVDQKDFNSYGSRRGNDEVMVRGTFANVRIRNKLAQREGGYTIHIPSGEHTSVYEASVKYKATNTPLIVLAGKEYGSGSSRDWAAKGTNLLGIKAVIAESYERIHRSNLIGMGVLPLEFLPGENAAGIGLTGTEAYTIEGISEGLQPLKIMTVTAKAVDGKVITFNALARIDSLIEVKYYEHGGILHYVLRDFLSR